MLKIYNTYSGKKEIFEPLNENSATMYVCGPTVYDKPHLGHARCYITWDVLYRYLKFSRYNPVYCRNVTDVDDKIIAKSKAENVTPDEIAKKYYDIFAEDMKRLNILKPDFEPFATKHIREMIELAKDLIDKGYAYEADGDVYFRVKKFERYGNLSKQPIGDLIAGARVETTGKKEDVLDFALWKKDDEFGYDSPWGKGRPGWHIECSAMSKKNLSKQIDIHAGGADLIFPHHENEIAQSECSNGCTFTKYWMHNGFVTIGKEKMSKSLNNFVSIDALLKTYDSNTIRFFILTNHYRMPVEFCDTALDSAKAGMKRLQTAVLEGLHFVANELDAEVKDEQTIELFKNVMDEDLNTSQALAILFDLASKVNKSRTENNVKEVRKYLSTLIELSNVLGFNFAEEKTNNGEIHNKLMEILDELTFLNDDDKKSDFNSLMQKIIDERLKAKSNKDFQLSDHIRDTLKGVGILLKDNKDQSTGFVIE